MNIKEDLLILIREFVANQPWYTGREEKIQVLHSNTGWLLIYGKDEMSGIMGVGATAETALADFKRSWKQLKGFEWIQRNR